MTDGSRTAVRPPGPPGLRPKLPPDAPPLTSPEILRRVAGLVR